MSKKLDWEKADDPDIGGQEWRCGPSPNETKFKTPDDRAGRRSAFFNDQVQIDPERPTNLKKLRNAQKAQFQEFAQSLPEKERAALKRRVRLGKSGKI